MRIATISVAAATLLISTGVAFALDSSVTMTSSMSPDALWKKIGDFCGIATWHPAFEKCVLSADGKQRTLSIKGGGDAPRGARELRRRQSLLHLHDPLWPPAGRQLSLDDQRFARSQGFVSEMGRQIRRQGVSDADAKKTSTAPTRPAEGAGRRLRTSRAALASLTSRRRNGIDLGDVATGKLDHRPDSRRAPCRRMRMRVWRRAQKPGPRASGGPRRSRGSVSSSRAPQLAAKCRNEALHKRHVPGARRRARLILRATPRLAKLGGLVGRASRS